MVDKTMLFCYNLNKEIRGSRRKISEDDEMWYLYILVGIVLLAIGSIGYLALVCAGLGKRVSRIPSRVSMCDIN
jgi:hypothetical protein